VKIRYGGKAATLSIVVGLVGIAWTPVMASIALGHLALVFGPFTLFGGVLLLGGLLMLRERTYVTIDDDKLVLHALVGPVKRTYPFASWSELELAGGKFSIAGKRVPIHRSQANAEDWDAFERELAAKRFT
jgi:hypothetical protein